MEIVEDIDKENVCERSFCTNDNSITSGVSTIETMGKDTHKTNNKRHSQDPYKPAAKKKPDPIMDKGKILGSKDNVSQDSSQGGKNQSGISYIKSDSGPYKGIINMMVEDKNNPPKPPMDMEISRKFIKMGIKFMVIDRTGRYRWEITFADKSAANNALNNPYIRKAGFTISIPWYLVYRKIVIKGIPTDITEGEIWEELKESNPNMVFDKEGIYRLKTRTYQDGEIQYVDSTTVRLNIRSTSIPSHIILWKTRSKVTPYIPNIRQCFKCGQLSHATKFCTNMAKCLTCSREIHEGAACSFPIRCINCEGSHKALSKECPEVIIKKRTTTLMATENIDYNVARKIVAQEGRTPMKTNNNINFGSARAPDIYSREFPRLPTKTQAMSPQPNSLKGPPFMSTKTFSSAMTSDKISDKDTSPTWTSNSECNGKWLKIMEFLNSHEEGPTVISEFFELISKHSSKSSSQNGQIKGSTVEL